MVQRVTLTVSGTAPEPKTDAVRVSQLQAALVVGGTLRDRYLPGPGAAPGQKPGLLARLASFLFGKPVDASTPEGEARLRDRADVLRRRIGDLEAQSSDLAVQEQALKARGHELARRERQLREALDSNTATDQQLATELATLRTEMHDVAVQFAGIQQQRVTLRVEFGALELARTQIEAQLGTRSADVQAELADVEKRIARVQQVDAAAARQESDLKSRHDVLADRAKEIEVKRRELAAQRQQLHEQIKAVVADIQTHKVELYAVQEQKRTVDDELTRARKDLEKAQREYERQRAARQAEERRLLEKAYEEKKEFEKYLDKKRDERDFEARRLATLQEARRQGQHDLEGRHLEAAYVAAQTEAAAAIEGLAGVAGMVPPTHLEFDGGTAARMRETADRRRQSVQARQEALPRAERQALAVALLATDKVGGLAPGAEAHRLVDDSSLERRRIRQQVTGI